MGFFSQLFVKTKTTQPEKATSSSADYNGEASLTSLTSSNHTHTSKSKKAEKSARHKKKTEKKSANVKAIEAFMEKGCNDPNGLVAQDFAPENVRAQFEDGFSLSVTDLTDALGQLYASCPDLRFTYESIEEEVSADGKTSTVTVDGLRCSGTHTGAPYSFKPGVFPAIPAAGTSFTNDEERFVFQVMDGKIQQMNIIALGARTGPPGVYEQIGGSLVPPSSGPE